MTQLFERAKWLIFSLLGFHFASDIAAVTINAERSVRLQPKHWVDVFEKVGSAFH
jgi:hypothetical protein